jgi:hypothetical protein
MRVLVISAALAWTLVGLSARGQEVIPAPAPVNGTSGGTGTDINAEHQPGWIEPIAATADGGPNDWRYRWHDGRWWYWTPENRWMWYSDAGQWMEFDANKYVTTTNAPLVGNERAYYPVVPVGVRPYGNVNVEVGRRIGVDVVGGHGAVRVGRICIGW